MPDYETTNRVEGGTPLERVFLMTLSKLASSAHQPTIDALTTVLVALADAMRKS